MSGRFVKYVEVRKKMSGHVAKYVKGRKKTSGDVAKHVEGRKKMSGAFVNYVGVRKKMLGRVAKYVEVSRHLLLPVANSATRPNIGKQSELRQFRPFCPDFRNLPRLRPMVQSRVPFRHFLGGDGPMIDRNRLWCDNSVFATGRAVGLGTKDVGLTRAPCFSFDRS
jgi:hypothetical protein